MNIEKYNKYYGYLLLLVAVYYGLLLVMQYSAPYQAWESWAHPNYTRESYVFLVLTYLLNIGVPLMMFIVGIMLIKKLTLKWYALLIFVFFLILSSIIGKVVLLVGVCVFGANKYYSVKST
jgi:hypothetical protein